LRYQRQNVIIFLIIIKKEFKMHNPYSDDDFEVIAHMSPDEVRQLDELQGGRHIDLHTKLPTYRPLFHLMQRDEIRPHIEELERSNFAGGGEVDGINQYLRDRGRYGDTEVVKLPRPIAELFDRALNGGKPSINPQTGKREYFLGSLLGSIGKIFSPITSTLGKFIPGLSAAGNAIKGAVNLGDLGNTALNTLGTIGQNAISSIGSGDFNVGNFAKNALSTAVNNFSPMAGKLAQTGLSAMGSEMGVPDLGQAAGNFANNMLSNVAPQYAQNYANNTPNQQNLGQAVAGAAGSGIQDSALGQNPYGGGAVTALNKYSGGMSPADSLYHGAMSTAQTMPNQLAGAALHTVGNAAQNMRGGMSPLNAMTSSIRSMPDQMRTGAIGQGMQYGRQGFQNLIDRYVPQRAG
jgi:hypothetical protein